MVKILLILFVLATSLPGLELSKVLEFGSDTIPEYLFFAQGPIAVDSERNMYVVDMSTKKIRKYDKKGKFITETGQEGQGPREFMSVSAVNIWQDSLLVFDSQNKRISQFDLDLNYIRSEQIMNVVSSFMTCAGEYLVFNQLRGFKKELVMLKPFSDQLKSVYEMKDFGKYSRYQESPLFSMLVNFIFSANHDDSGFIASLARPFSGSPELLFFDHQGELLRRTRIEAIVKYERDEKSFDVNKARELIGTTADLTLWRLFCVDDEKSLLVCRYQEAPVAGQVKARVEFSMVLVDNESGRIMGRHVLDDNLLVRAYKDGYVYIMVWHFQTEKVAQIRWTSVE